LRTRDLGGKADTQAWGKAVAEVSDGGVMETWDD
jgi:hypothetical protein